MEYKNKSAEISFLTETNLNQTDFNIYWEKFITLLQVVAFKELQFLKIYAYVFDVRPKLYLILEKIGFLKEARIRNDYVFHNKVYDSYIYSLWNSNVSFRKVKVEDLFLTYDWAKSKKMRHFSLNNNAISFEEHSNWFSKVIIDNKEHYFIGSISNLTLGSLRFTLNHQGSYTISFLIDKQFQGLRLSKGFLKQGINYFINSNGPQNFKAKVHVNNKPSKRVFESIGFIFEKSANKFNTYTLDHANWKF
jgi:RimJ/RimL family protein N-acetyltransferase